MMQGFFTRQSFYAARLKVIADLLARGETVTARQAVGELRADLTGVMVLVYHEVGPGQNQNIIDPAVFRQQMEAVRDSGVPVLRYDDLFAAEFPRAGIIITFDDARRGFLTHAFPVLRELSLPATMFITPGYLDDPGSVPEAERFSDFMTWDDIAGLADSALLDWGCHAATHPDMTTLGTEALQVETHGARRRIAEACGIATRDFAYPFGKFNALAEAAVRRAGFRSASTILTGRNTASTDPGRLRRTVVLRLISPRNFDFLIHPKAVHDELDRYQEVLACV